MINAIYGKKIGMTQVWDGDVIVPVTVIQAEPNVICQVKTKESDGYDAVQMGFGYVKPRRVNKPMQGHFSKAGIEPKKHLREVRVEDASEHKVGDEQTVAVLWASALRPPACSRACAFPATWAVTPSRSGTWRSFASTRSRTSSC